MKGGNASRRSVCSEQSVTIEGVSPSFKAVAARGLDPFPAVKGQRFLIDDDFLFKRECTGEDGRLLFF